MLEGLRTTVGTKLIDVSDAIVDVAPDFQRTWNPNGESSIGGFPGAAAHIMDMLGHTILPRQEGSQ